MAPPGSARWRMTGAEDRQPVPGRDQLAHRPAGAVVQAIPDQRDRAVQLLVRGVQEPGVIRLVNPLRSRRAGRGASGRWPGRHRPGPRSRGHDARVSCPPVTVTTGVPPPRPQVRPFGGLRPWPTRLRSRARRPGPPPRFYDRPGVLPPPGDLLLIPLRRPPRRDLHRPAEPVPAARPSPPACTPPRTAARPDP